MMVPWMLMCWTDTTTPSRLPDKNIYPLFCLAVDVKKILQCGGDCPALQNAVIAH
jgi:hypothetical protein